jgi:soluble lytic murein transglycosylase-like protein
VNWSHPSIFARTLFPSAVTLFLGVGILGSGCSSASKMGSTKSTSGEGTPMGVPELERKLPASAFRSANQAATENSSREGVYFYKGLQISQKDYDFPITMNDSVAFWVDYFSNRGRKFFEKYLERSELFIPYIQPILKQYGLPQDLVYLAMIESGFANHARSQAKAVGPWQFMPFTGRRYGLAVNWWVDERRDTEKSTHSAAKYLKDLYTMFDSWELAASGYNAGETKIARAIQRYGTTDYWSLTRQNFLRRETRDYVPKIMAAAIVAKNRAFFGFQVGAPKPKKGEALAPNGEVVRLESVTAQAPHQAAKEALESVLKNGDSGTGPEGTTSTAEEDNDTGGADDPVGSEGDLVAVSTTPSPADEEKNRLAQARPIQTPHVNKKGELVGEELVDFEVDGPADLMKISRAANLSYHTVKGLNPEILRWCTPPQFKKYTLRLPISSKEEFLKNYNHPDFQKRVEFLTFRVNRPQSLSSVAHRFGLKAEPISELNRMPLQMVLRKGTLVKLPIPAEGERNLAALDLKDPPEKRKARRAKRRRSARGEVTTLYERSRFAERDSGTRRR